MQFQISQVSGGSRGVHRVLKHPPQLLKLTSAASYRAFHYAFGRHYALTYRGFTGLYMI